MAAMLWKILLLILAVPVLLSVAALLGNGVSFTAPPGVAARLTAYMRHNVAELAPQHTFPELRNPEYAWPADELRQRARQAAGSLGWTVDEAGDDLHAVVVTPLVGFKDDVLIRAESLGEDRSRLQVRSASRVGKADFGANRRHVMDLIEKIEESK